MSNLIVNGVTLKYVEQGNGQAIVFVHGSASDYRTWQSQLDEFGKDFRVIAYSRRYHWPNEPIPEEADYSMMEHVDDLQALIRSLEAAPVHLAGHSYGAFICLLLAMRDPELIRSLVLAEPPAITLFVSNTPKPREIIKLLITRPKTAAAIIKFGVKGVAPATAAAKKGDMEKALRIFGHTVLGPETFLNLTKTRLEQAKVNNIRAEFTGSGYPPLDDERLQQMRIPTLLMKSEKGPAMFGCLIERLEELLPNTEKVEIKDASHIMHEDNPSDYNEAVRSFLAENSNKDL
jgi:pimeloyl-ACP methyl ester carboxylesterase